MFQQCNPTFFHVRSLIVGFDGESAFGLGLAEEDPEPGDTESDFLALPLAYPVRTFGLGALPGGSSTTGLGPATADVNGNCGSSPSPLHTGGGAFPTSLW